MKEVGVGYASVTQHLEAPPERVYAYICDPMRLLTWLTLFGAVTSQDDTLDQVGAKFDADLAIGTHHVGSVWEVTAAEAPRILHLRGGDEHGSDIDVWISLGAWDGGTEFEFEVAYDLGRGLVTAIADRTVGEYRVGRELERSLTRLAERLSAG